MVLLFAVLGVLGLFNLGMAGTGYWWLYQGAWLVAVLFSARWGLIFSLAVTSLVAGVGAAFVSGALVPAVDLNELASSASAWAAFVVAIFFASMILLLAFSGYQATAESLIAEVTAQRNELARVAAHDQLTGLPLMRLATDRLEMALHAARRAHDKVAVMFIDLDGFKAVNDRQGHEAGNQVLREIGARLQHAVRSQDTVARIGGDEFVVVLGQLKDAETAAPIARKLLADIALPIPMAGGTAQVGASIGIALYPEHGETAADLLREADRAMYAVKHSGRNGFDFARPPVR
jgi:diguanylate cyclase (GGDEF)-like protein